MIVDGYTSKKRRIAEKLSRNRENWAIQPKCTESKAYSTQTLSLNRCRITFGHFWKKVITNLMTVPVPDPGGSPGSSPSTIFGTLYSQSALATRKIIIFTSTVGRVLQLVPSLDTSKVGCVFPVTTVSILSHAEYSDGITIEKAHTMRAPLVKNLLGENNNLSEAIAILRDFLRKIFSF